MNTYFTHCHCIVFSYHYHKNLIFVISLTVLQNIALGKPAEQSLKSSPFRAEYAVDGNRGTDFEKDKCSFAGSEQHNWWMVDLQTVYSIKTVRMLNMGYPYERRYDMCKRTK